MNIVKKVVILFFIILTGSILAAAAEIRIPDAEELAHSLYDINKNWDFYQGRFISPEEFYPGSRYPSPDSTVNLPHIWKGDNAGTYHVRISGLKPDMQYGMYIFERFGTAGKIFCNGRFAGQDGTVNRNGTGTKPDYSMKPVELLSDSDGILDIVCYVSSSNYRKGGLWDTLQIAEMPVVKNWISVIWNRDAFFIGTLFLIFIYNIILSIVKRGEKSQLFLAFFALAIMIRTITAEFSVFELFFSNFPYRAETALEFFAVPAGSLFFFLYIKFLYKPESFKIVDKLLTGAGILLTVVITLLPVKFSNFFIPPSQIYLLIVVLFSLVIIFRGQKKSSGNIIVLNVLSIFVILIATVHDVFTQIPLTVPFPGVTMLPYSFLVFMIFNSVILALFRADAIKNLETAQSEYTKLNKAYYRFIPTKVISLLGRENIQEVQLSDKKELSMAVFCFGIPFKNASIQTINKYFANISSYITKTGGIVASCTASDMTVVFPENKAVVFSCAAQIKKNAEKLLEDSSFAQEKIETLYAAIDFGPVCVGMIGRKDLLQDFMMSKVLLRVKRLKNLAKEIHEPVLVSRSAEPLYIHNPHFYLTEKTIPDAASSEYRDLYALRDNEYREKK